MFNKSKICKTAWLWIRKGLSKSESFKLSWKEAKSQIVAVKNEEYIIVDDEQHDFEQKRPQSGFVADLFKMCDKLAEESRQSQLECIKFDKELDELAIEGGFASMEDYVASLGVRA
jgi:hypothetical protein